MKPEVDLLTRYRQESMALRDFEAHMEQLTRPAGPRGMSLPRLQSEATNDPESASRQLEEGLEALLANKRAYLKSMEASVLSILMRAHTPAMLSVLIGYYMLGYSTEEAGEYAHVTQRQAQRLRKDFLNTLQ